MTEMKIMMEFKLNHSSHTYNCLTVVINVFLANFS